MHGVLLATAALALAWAVPVRAADIVVVVNDQLRVEALTEAQVREIYLGERHYWGGVRFRPITYPDGAELMLAFRDRVIAMSADEYRSWWIKRIFRQADTPPASVGSQAEALRRIAATPGAIGFVRDTDLDGAPGVRPVLRLAP